MRVRAFIITMLLLVCSYVEVLGQRELPITVETIKYQIIYVSRQMIGKKKVVPSKHLIQVEVNSITKEELKKIKKEQWITLLNDETIDWLPIYFFTIYLTVMLSPTMFL